MKKGIHPEYREVVFLDTSSGEKILTRSTIQTSETIEHEGQEYPLVKVEISSFSHPFYTGKMKYVDSAGRVEKFQKKYGWGKKEAKDEKESAEETAEASK
jgi:large subunit ribosomal protein L31